MRVRAAFSPPEAGGTSSQISPASAGLSCCAGAALQDSANHPLALLSIHPKLNQRLSVYPDARSSPGAGYLSAKEYPGRAPLYQQLSPEILQGLVDRLRLLVSSSFVVWLMSVTA